MLDRCDDEHSDEDGHRSAPQLSGRVRHYLSDWQRRHVGDALQAGGGQGGQAWPDWASI